MKTQSLPFIAFLCLALGMWAAMEYRPAPAAPQAATPLPPLPLRALEGDRVDETWAPEAGRVSIVNFFASWCTPCLAEHPNLKTLSRMKGVDLHGIAWNDKPENLRAYLKKNGNPYDSVWRDSSGKAAIAVGLRGVPETYVVGRDGKIRLHIRGALNDTSTRKLTALLEQLRTEEVAADAPLP